MSSGESKKRTKQAKIGTFFKKKQKTMDSDQSRELESVPGSSQAAVVLIAVPQPRATAPT